ncbi:MarR family winged helix-turn-helix transcriptional regulator [Aquabacter cavernae]|uniref:MarR family winged helix-turn-helix transcriptional regulator n=1 Tax=Aquabacter cavernae TaxID=2496029 RepID=UPI000F8E5AD0|nr:MarR family winged helix-turn-helix transcriptional regulator [Aquabacter cavernae]
MTGPNISQTQRTLGYLLRHAYECLSEQVYGSLAARGFADIRRAHSNVFRHIAAGGSRVSDLAERAHMTKQGMAYLVESLAGLGYLEVMPDPADGRAKLARLTVRGDAASRELVRLSREAEETFAAALPPGDMERLRGQLEGLVAKMGARGA